MKHHQFHFSKWALLLGLFVVPNFLFAADAPKQSDLNVPLAQALVVIVIVLLICIALLANVVLGAANLYLQRFKEEKEKNNLTTNSKIVSILILMLTATSVFAQEVNTQEKVELIGGMSQASFYSLFFVILLELIVIIFLIFNLKTLLQKEVIIVYKEAKKPTENYSLKWWNKLNSFRPIKEEAEIDLGHDYDGIRELDNRLPGWWVYGFAFTIVFAMSYLWRYHVAQSAPLSHEELTISLEKAAIEKEEYLKKSANSVDENTVKLLTDEDNLAAGKKIFTTTCAACHAADGGGIVGPNLTDDYWLHGGTIKDIFKTIKYGWPEKGMKSWKDDYSPIQIAQLTSYVKSLHGTKPSIAKEPQGTLYVENNSNKKDSIEIKNDSLIIKKPTK
jgi:cytochrome c oxidase cbb3-type subunit 3